MNSILTAISDRKAIAHVGKVSKTVSESDNTSSGDIVREDTLRKEFKARNAAPCQKARGDAATHISSMKWVFLRTVNISSLICLVRLYRSGL